MLKHVFIFIGLVLFATGTFAESNQFSLQQCIEYSLKNNRAMKNAKIDAEIANSKVWETTAMGLPQLNASSQLQYFIDIPTQLIPDFLSPAVYGVLVKEGVRDRNGNTVAFPVAGSNQFFPARFGTNYSFSYGLDASWLLFDGSYLAGLSASKAYKKMASELTNRTEVDTRVAVTKSYYNVLVNTERLKLLDANVARLKKTMDDTKVLFENGFVEKVDYNRLQVLYNNLLVEQQKFTQLLGMGMLSLKFQIGMALDDELVLTDKLDKIPFTPSIEKIDSVDYTLRPDYKAAAYSKRLYELDLRRSKLSYLPTVVAFGTYSKNSPQNNFSDILTGTMFPTTLVGFKVSMPIFGSFKKYQQYKQAKLNLQKSTTDLETFKEAINMEAKMAQISYNNSISSLQNQKSNMELAKEVVRVAKAKYDQGVGSSLEVITAETSLKESETNYIASLYDALAARVDMDKAQGLIK